VAQDAFSARPKPCQDEIILLATREVRQAEDPPLLSLDLTLPEVVLEKLEREAEISRLSGSEKPPLRGGELAEADPVGDFPCRVTTWHRNIITYFMFMLDADP
jgi:hypothetical protein